MERELIRQIEAIRQKYQDEVAPLVAAVVRLRCTRTAPELLWILETSHVPS